MLLIMTISSSNTLLSSLTLRYTFSELLIKSTLISGSDMAVMCPAIWGLGGWGGVMGERREGVMVLGEGKE